MKPSSYRGFTLVELLVVIAIIGILSSVVLTSLTAARNSANDSTRFSDLRQVQQALEAYAGDHNGLYPKTYSGGVQLYNTVCSTGNQVTEDNVIPNLVSEGYIPRIPKDPQTDVAGGKCCYYYISDGDNYKFQTGNSCVTSNYKASAEQQLLDPVRNGAGYGHSPSPGNCYTGQVCSWSVYTSGAATW